MRAVLTPRRATLFAMAILLCACASSDRVLVVPIEANYVIFPEVSNLALVVPKGGFASEKPPGTPDSPRYFYLADEAQALIVSGWFEPESAYPGIDAYWRKRSESIRATKQPELVNPRFGKIGNWDVVQYQTDVPGLVNSHLVAEWVEAGTWIDLHLSITSRGPAEENQRRLEALLRTFVVKTKP